MLSAALLVRDPLVLPPLTPPVSDLALPGRLISYRVFKTLTDQGKLATSSPTLLVPRADLVYVCMCVCALLRGDGRAQERPLHHRHAQVGRPVPQHQARQHQGTRHRETPTHGTHASLHALTVLAEATKSRTVELTAPSLPPLCLCAFVRLDSHLQATVKNCFIRGSVVRYVQLPSQAMDTQLLEDATRRGSYQAELTLAHPLS